MKYLPWYCWALLSATALTAAACDGYGGVAPAPVLASLRLALADSAVEVGQFTQATVMGVDQYGVPIATGPVTFVSSRPEVAAIMPTTGRILAIAPGTTLITANAGEESAQQSLTVSISPIRINEVEPDGDGSGGWVEFYNPTDAAVDVSDWQLASGNPFATLRFHAGTVIPANGYLVVEETLLPLGLGSVSQVHVFGRFSVPVDAYVWKADPITSYGRCPDGTGEFVVTAGPSRGAANRCGQTETPARALRPGEDRHGP